MLAVINALIVEHLTIYNVVLACGVLVYTICVHRKVVASHVAYLIGSVAGAAYMFQIRHIIRSQIIRISIVKWQREE